MKKCSRQHEGGNVLFLILIAVALFAALSYAVTQSSRSGAGTADGETALVNSAQITQYPAAVRTSIVRMIIGGVDVTELEFDPPPYTDSTAGRRVFHPADGGATYVTAPPDVMHDGQQGTWVFSSSFQIVDIGTTGDGDATANDIIAFLPGVARSVCQKINSELGITGGTDTDGDGVPVGMPTLPASATHAMTRQAPVDNGTASSLIGAAAAAATHHIGGAFAGQPFGCFDQTDGTQTAGDLVYYHVLVER
ncbi:MAG: hypothetical protein EOM26_03635 [Alphaproteobacteria bacterium]|nr:hypothetical protein [Alphaproteobacteria bacterium]